MKQPARISTFFPYTTLFRSETAFDVIHAELVELLRDHEFVLKGEVESLDRKSTRLNSSHSSISYAVFCLKKQTLLSPHRYPRSIPMRVRHNTVPATTPRAML